MYDYDDFGDADIEKKNVKYHNHISNKVFLMINYLVLILFFSSTWVYPRIHFQRYRN